MWVLSMVRFPIGEKRLRDASNGSPIRSITKRTRRLRSSTSCEGTREKTVALAEPIKRSFEPYAGAIKSAFVYGSVANGSDTASSDIDLMVIGDNLNYSDLYTAAQAAEAALRRKVNPLFVSRKDWRRKISNKGSVFDKINHSPKIFVIGSEKDLERGQARTR